MSLFYSTINSLRDRYAAVVHKSTFRVTGQITPEEFVAAGDYLTFKFPTWVWADASAPDKRVAYLPPGKQFLVTRNVPCERRLDDQFAGDAVLDESLVGDGLGADGPAARPDDDGWLRTGTLTNQKEKVQDIRTVDDAGNVGERAVDDDDDIPDMDDDDDEAIIHEASSDNKHRTYSLYIAYSPFYRTPRMYMSGYTANGQPLPPHLMMDDIVGDYKDKTVTVEDFPFFTSTKMASVHPCKHASVMKTLLDRADAALKLRRERLAAGAGAGPADAGVEGLVDGLRNLDVSGVADRTDEWEEVKESEVEDADADTAIRVDQYLIVFLKFMASVTPSIEYDFTMGI